MGAAHLSSPGGGHPLLMGDLKPLLLQLFRDLRISKPSRFLKFEKPSSQGLLLPVHKKDRKSTRLNSSHGYISYAVFRLKKPTTPPAGLAPSPRRGRGRRSPPAAAPA